MPISINASDNTKYLGTKTNLTLTMLQSTTKKDDLNSLIFWDPSTVLIKIKIQRTTSNTMPNYRCKPF